MATGAEIGVIKQLQVQRNGGLYGADLELPQGSLEALNARGSVRSMNDQFTDHGVIVWRNAISSAGVAINPNAGTTRCGIGFNQARLRHESTVRILSVDAHFNGMTIDVNVLLREWQLFTGSNANAGLHDVYSSDHFRHWVLYLHAGIHFQHVEVLLAIHQEFHGGGAGILGFANECCRAFANAIALLWVHARRRGLFNQFLVAALA